MMDLSNFIKSILLFLSFYLSASYVVNMKIKYDVRVVLLISIVSLILNINYFFVDIFFRVLISFILIHFLLNISLRLDFKNAFVISIILYLSLIIIEVVGSVVLISLSIVFNKNVYYSITNSLFINLLISVSLLLSVFIFCNNYRILFKFLLDKFCYLKIRIMPLIIIFSILFSMIEFDNKYNNLKIFLLIIFLYLFLIFIIKRFIIENSLYKELEEYNIINENLIEEYRCINHENKNNLLVIKSLIEENKGMINCYINTLIGSSNVSNKCIFTSLKYIPIIGMKGVIAHKLSFISDSVIINVDISKDVKNIFKNNCNIAFHNTLITLFNIYFDNALDSLINFISISMYMDKNNFLIEIVNDYNNKIDIDQLDDLGYSTKSKSRGVGLSLARKIINKNKFITVNRDIGDNYFVQKICIDTKK